MTQPASDLPGAAFLQTLADAARRAVEAPLQILIEGNPRRIPNPFRPGETMEVGATASSKQVAAVLRAAGLHQDPEFVKAISAMLAEVAQGPVWALLDALDGEGQFHDGAQYRVVDEKGQEINGYLHEIYWQFERKQ